MPILIQCPNPVCAASSSVPDALNGRGVKCKRCGTPFKATPTLDGESNETQKSKPSSSGNPFPTLPAEFGRYHVTKLLGRGGMGAVYLARDTQLGRQVALKLPSFDASDTRRVERFVREAQAAAGLMHPNICPVFDAGKIDGRPFITMGYIDGNSLDSLIDPDAPMDPTRAAGFARKVAAALHAAHETGIVHRDLKPANVMLTAKGEPVVMDFGLAKRVAETDANEAKLTHDGAVMGTPSYMAPEQVKGELERIGPATDVYSLGVMLFEMLTGRTPYTGPLGMVMGQILIAPVRRPSELRPETDPQLDDACHRAMAKDPADRFPNMVAFGAALDEFLQGPNPASISVSLLDMKAPATPFADLGYDLVNEPPAETKKTRTKVAKAPSRLPLYIAAGVIGLLLIVAGVLMTIKTKHGDVVIDLGDNVAGVEVKIDGARVELTGIDKPITLTAGEHGLTVTGADFETLAQSFTVKKNEKQVVKVTLKPKAVAVAAVVPQVGTNTLWPELTAAGDFVPLFNGKDLTGWVSEKGGIGNWVVADGAITCTGPIDNLYAVRNDFADFHLRAEVKINRTGNSGIFFRAGKPLDKGDDYEMNIWAFPDQQKYGTLWGLVPSTDSFLKPDTWATHEIIAKGNRIRLFMDGKETARYVEERPGRKSVGYLALQHWSADTKVFFRKIEIKEVRLSGNTPPPLQPLAPVAGFTPLFNGKDLTGWAADGDCTDAEWKADAGGIAIAGGPQPTWGFLLGKQDYTDFVLRMQFQQKTEAAKTGIIFRGVPGMRVGSLPCQCKVNLENADNSGATLWGSKSEYKAPDKPAKLKPVGEWNDVELDVRGQILKVTINGDLVQTIDFDAYANQPTALASLKRPAGRIGLQKHLGDVKFRNIEIKELSPAPVAGFTPLFNGKDLTGWNRDGGAEGAWAVESGELVGRSMGYGTRSYLLSEKNYGDFELRLELKPQGQIRAGVALRAITAEKVPFGNMMAFDHPLLKFCNFDPDWVGTPYWFVNGSNQRPDVESELKPGWNAVQITVNKLDCRVVVNGKQVLAFKATEAMRAEDFVPGLAREAGKIGFQACNGEVRIRNVEIKELSPAPVAGFTPLFNGKDLTGWAADGDCTAAEWKTDAGGIAIAGGPQPTWGFLLGKQDYTDFVLRMQFQQKTEAAKSGIIFRGVPGMRVGKLPYQCKVNLQNADNSGATLWGSKSEYKAPDKPAKLKPVGEWNDVELDLRGQILKVTINGDLVQTIDFDAYANQPTALAALKRPAGRIGLQKHLGDVKFRNIEIKETAPAAAGLAPENSEWAGAGMLKSDNRERAVGGTWTFTERRGDAFKALWRSGTDFKIVFEGTVSPDGRLTLQAREQLRPTEKPREEVKGIGELAGNRMTVVVEENKNKDVTRVEFKRLPDAGKDFKFQGRWKCNHVPRNWNGFCTITDDKSLSSHNGSPGSYTRDGGLFILDFLSDGGREWLIMNPDNPNELKGVFSRNNVTQYSTWTRE